MMLWKMGNSRLWIAVALFSIFAGGCTKEKPNNPISLFSAPSHFPEPVYQNPNNSLSKEGIALGKALFFDPILSVDSTISCASCHNQEFAFSDNGKRLSTGVRNQIGTRNTPPLFNLAWHTSFMWDGGVNHLEVVPLAPITLDIEMDEEIVRVLKKLNANNAYRKSFEEVFDTDTITDKYFFYALTQYMSFLVSSNAKYDLIQQVKASYTDAEKRGYYLYSKHCASCHTEPLFTDHSFKNNGLDSVFTDVGRMRITSDENDKGKFKVPTLRNLSYTGPYMHDGRFESLVEVIDHYSEGILPSQTKEAGLFNLKLSDQEKQSLLLFLQTLDDPVFVSDERY